MAVVRSVVERQLDGSGLIWCIRFAVGLRSAIRTYWRLQPISRVDSALDNLDDFLEYICIIACCTFKINSSDMAA